jgi:RNA polymerase sigma-70 factor (family 1)
VFEREQTIRRIISNTERGALCIACYMKGLYFRLVSGINNEAGNGKDEQFHASKVGALPIFPEDIIIKIPLNAHEFRCKILSKWGYETLAVKTGSDNFIQPYFMKQVGGHSAFSIDAFCKGNQQAFNFIFDCYYRSVCFFASRLIPAKPIAEDITQEAFVRLWEKHNAFDCERSIKAFLYVITRNACLNFLKQGRRSKQHEDYWFHLVEEAEDPPATFVQSEMISKLSAAIESLPPECRRVMQLCYIEGLQNKNIARKLGVSVHTVKNQKARGLALLKKRLTPAFMFN